MTLPTGTITMNDIRTEYGLSGALALGSLYAGGSIIAAGSGGINGAIPSSGAISLNNFRGHSAIPAVTHTITQGTYGSGTSSQYYGFWAPLSMGSIIDVPDTSQIGNAYFNNGSVNLQLKMVTRINNSSGFTLMVQMGYSSAVASDAFDSLTVIANGNTITMDTSAAYTSGSYQRSWLWNASFGLTSTEVSDLTTEFDGSGTIDLRFVA
tara:strand:+ start:75 stop:701 length:627 start_codon:yes stop_codon:yes gene_type:complete